VNEKKPEPEQEEIEESKGEDSSSVVKNSHKHENVVKKSVTKTLKRRKRSHTIIEQFYHMQKSDN